MKQPLVQFALLLAMMTANSSWGADWPQWRGPNRDGISPETGLLKKWTEEGPPLAWKIDNAGVGYSSLAVANDRVFTQGDLDGVEHILCFSEKDGSLLWAVQPEPVAKALAAKVAERFEVMDKNQDGVVDEFESIAGIGRFYILADAATEGDAEKIAAARAAAFIAHQDQDGNGWLGFAEVPRQLQSDYFRQVDTADKMADPATLAGERTEQALKLDADKDGQLSREEVRDTLVGAFFSNIDKRAQGEDRADMQLTAEELKKFFSDQMKGRDGKIRLPELIHYFQNVLPGRDGKLAIADLNRHYGGYRNSFGDGPRGTPTVDGDRVYAEGGNGDLTCLDVATGKTIWHVNLAADLGGGRPGWGYSESPLIVGDLIVVTPGGRQGTMAALNKKSGEVVWRSTEVTEGAHYSSPMLARLAGTEQIVQFARESVFGVTLEGGKFLWKYSGANNGTANVCTPVIDNDHVLATSSYGKGAGLVHISGGGDAPQAEEVYFEKKMAVQHGGAVKVGDYIYGFGSGLVCMNYLTGEIAWQSRSVGKGSLSYADGHLYCVGERNEIGLVEANPEKYVEKGRFKVAKSKRALWPHPVIANGRLYIRDLGALTCYNIRGMK